MTNTFIASIVLAAVMTLAGFLSFQVQPVLAKFILPWFGGSATTWTVCMLFFQVALLVGYAWAYALTRPLTIRMQAKVQIGLLLVAMLLLPITPSESFKPADAEQPIGRILWLLTVSVGVPYVLISTTSPLLQRWLAALNTDLKVSRFFALSNLGSFFGLLSYPFIFERLMSSTEQTWWWSVAFGAYAVLFIVAAFIVLRGLPEEADRPSGGGLALGAGDKPLSWIVFSALGSVLLLATTNQITQWSAVVPFLWILPLSLYLLTFVIAFGHQELYDRGLFLLLFAAFAVASFEYARPETSSSFLVAVALQNATLFIGCMICHGEMVRRQPPAERLPTFYLAIALGGALGGVLVTLVAPLVFTDYHEHPIVVVAIALITAWLVWRRSEPDPALARRVAPVIALIFLGGFAFAMKATFDERRDTIDQIRNFYGVVKILKEDEDDPDEFSLVMRQAGVDQGSQFQTAARKMEPACAFDKESGIGRALAHHRKRREGGDKVPLKIGIIGLGAGMVAGLGREGDEIRYYELNPAVPLLVDRHFTFLKAGKAKTDIAVGDGRLVLERELKEGTRKYDVLVINAFRGASPPMHLMTQEAFAIYLGHLEPDGILAINFELDTFEMAPLHRGLAKAFGLSVNWVETPETEECDSPVSWALYTKDTGFWDVPAVKKVVSPWRDKSDSTLLWTDKSSNLMSILNWGK